MEGAYLKRGILFIHGFTGNTTEVQPLVDYLMGKRSEWTCSVVTLTGHGEALNLKGVSSEHWFRDVENAYRLLEKQVDEVIVVGFSMGGLLALYLALRYRVKKLILLSTAAKFVDVKKLFLTCKELIKQRKQLTTAQARFLQAAINQTRHMTVPTMKHFLKVVHTVLPYLHRIHQPTMIIQGEKDGVVPKEAASFLYEQIQSVDKQMYFSKSGEHHICYSDDQNEWFERVFQFIIADKRNQNIMPDCN